MRFVSWSPGFQITASPELKQKVEQLADGSTRELRAGFICQFTPDDWTEREREQLYKRFPKEMTKGSRLGMDGTPINDDWKISTYDTAKIEDAELRAKVEKGLLENFDNGIHYILVESPRIPSPWGNYDEIVVRGQRTIDRVVAQICATVEDLGFDPAQVAAYERENLNRQEVLDGLAKLAEQEPVEETIEVSA